ncbi:MAG: FUSC family protein [Desulfopila sp.]
MNSERFLFATRLAVSVVVAVGLSLALGWEKPIWAMFAVIYCALGDKGESYHKGLMRVLATLMGGCLSLVFMALFNDHRWAFSGAVVCWISVCAYLMQDNRRYYFWYVAGWMTILMPIYSAGHPALAFETLMLRLEETTLGVLVYTLISNVILVDRRQRNFIHELRGQVENLKQILVHLDAAYRRETEEKTGGSPLGLRRQARMLHTNFLNRIDAGIVESFDIINKRDTWRRAIDEYAALVDRLGNLSVDVRSFIDKYPQLPLPDVRPVLGEIERRLNQTIALLDGQNDLELPQKVPLPHIDQLAAAENPFDHGTVLISLEALADIDRRSANLLLLVAKARGIPVEGGYSSDEVGTAAAPLRSLIPDPEKLALVLRTAVTFWLAFAIYIFVPDFPNGTMVILLSTIYGMLVAMRPTINLRAMEIPATVTFIFAGILHLVVMPKLSSFLGLGIMLYLYVFIGAWVFGKPERTPMRFIVLGFSSMVLQITNDQVYSFLYVANMVISYQVPFFLLLVGTRSAPISFRPEAAFQRLLRRYMASFRYLIEDIRRDLGPYKGGWWRRQVHAYHLRNLARIPDNMSAWVAIMPKAAMSEEEKAQGQALCLSLYELTTQMTNLSRLRSNIRFNAATIERMHPAIHAWRGALQGLIETFRDTPNALPTAIEMTTRLNTLQTQVGGDLRATLASGAETVDSITGRTLLRELSAYRILSETLINAAQQASTLRWERICETRF